ncbi:MAG: hypothetical protein GY847_36430 [Proteobacteria bacterium]|nr:hypothetical protein [Pseudomonadota bacterium]
MTHARILLLVALTMMLSLGCGNDDDDDTGTDADSDGDLVVDVTYNDATQTIELTGLATTTIDETEVVVLETIIAEFSHAPVLDSITLNFEGSDGWMPGNSDNCADVVPIEGALASQGGVDVSTLALVWEEAADLPGCMGVKELAVIHITDI